MYHVRANCDAAFCARVIALKHANMSLPSAAEVDAALQQASAEHGLQSWYSDCVRPLLNMPQQQWPRCCGGGCEPCNQTLVAVASRVLELLAPPPHLKP